MLRIVGGLIFVLGAGLWIGNVSGAFPTFPLAGYLTMLVGGVVFRVGGASA